MNVTFFGRRVSADVTKNPEIEGSSWIISIGPECHHKCPYKREAKGDDTDPVKREAATGVMEPQSQECQDSHNRQGTDSPRQPP